MSLSYKAIMTSDKQDWETPQDLFDNLNNEFDFDLDAFASDKNAKCKHFLPSKTMHFNKIGLSISQYLSIHHTLLKYKMKF